MFFCIFGPMIIFFSFLGPSVFYLHCALDPVYWPSLLATKYISPAIWISLSDRWGRILGSTVGIWKTNIRILSSPLYFSQPCKQRNQGILDARDSNGNFDVFKKIVHSMDLKSDHLNFGLFEDQISNGLALAIAIVPTIQNPDVFVQISNVFWQNGSHLSGFQMIGLPEFRSHWKSRPFATQPVLDHSRIWAPTVNN